MPNWDSFGWILAIAFVIGFVILGRWIFLKIKAQREKKDVDKRLKDTLGGK